MYKARLKFQLLLLTGLLLLASGCFFEDDALSDDVVLTEDIVFVSSNKIRVLGRIFSATGDIRDHGFEFALDADFSDPITFSLGQRSDIGSFMVEAGSLTQDTRYFYRAYLETDRVVYSEAGEISTFDSSIADYEPKVGNPGDMVTITGMNLTDSIRVMFGGEEANIVEVISDFIINVEVPDHSNNIKVPIAVILDEKELQLDSFEYITGKWTIASEIDHRVFDVVQFQDENSFTFAMGSLPDGSAYSRKSYTLNFDDFSWEEGEVNIPVPRSGSYFTNDGFFGSGASGIIHLSETDFNYNLEQDVYFFNGGNPVLVANAVVPAFGAIGFDLNDRKFVIGGLSDRRLNTNSFYEYIDGNWFTVDDYGGPINYEGVNESYQGNQLFLDLDENWWRFDPESNDLQKVGQFERSARQFGLMKNIDGQLHFGLFRFENLFWRMDFKDFESFDYELVPKNPFPGDVNYINVASFVHNGDMYFLRASPAPSSDAGMTLWRFQPNEFE